MYYDKSKFTDSDVKSLDKMLEKNKVAFNITEGWYMSSFLWSSLSEKSDLFWSEAALKILHILMYCFPDTVLPLQN